ncbi:MAG: hypothetical protein M3308_09695, partial [Actinomycetota bacterium]|nr:hypothetical protein [Actinomycetota bacterium]
MSELNAGPRRPGSGFEPLDNGFAAIEDVHRLQQICDSLGPEYTEALLCKWLRFRLDPFTSKDET